MNKRDDIQWLRAAAIFSVLLFHIWPKYFPYGYLGVDIFFVISGYLMTKILCKPSTNPKLLDFYLRRIKRIFPTCLFVITLTLFIGFNLLLYTHFWGMLIEGIWSIFFVNNLSPFFSAKHYFDMVTKLILKLKI
uniref:Acyltransferase 3 domain-containing protein n=1 Tax=Panagrolaimus sp. PS1159 TaxID=55785 RepID=A0AC35GB04_9BILA